jgi:hypothetical protein
VWLNNPDFKTAHKVTNETHAYWCNESNQVRLATEEEIKAVTEINGELYSQGGSCVHPITINHDEIKFRSPSSADFDGEYISISELRRIIEIADKLLER